jgi:hypothetical protein
MNRGDWVELKGISRHGKNRINQHGTKWVVNALGTFNGNAAVRCRSENKTFRLGSFGKKMHDERWVLLKNDENFEIVSKTS